jgi:hypothetical protein
MITEQFLLKNGLRKIENLKLKLQTYHITHFNVFDLECDVYVYGKKPWDYITIILTPKGHMVVVGPHKGPRFNREVFPIETEQEVLEWIRGERKVAYYVQG